MAKNLEEKLQIILEDTETLSRSETIRRLKDLIHNEINFLENEHTVNMYDLNVLHSSATDLYQNYNIAALLDEKQLITDLGLVRTWCYLDSVIGFLRSKNLISFTVRFESQRKRRR